MRRVVLEHRSGPILVHVAEGRRERVRGLIGRPADPPLLLQRTRSVHTFGMRDPIEVVLLDGRMRVLRILTLRPRRLLLPRPRVRAVLEMRSSPFTAGDRLRLREPSGEERSQEGEDEERGEREGDDGKGEQPAGPGGKDQGLAAAGRGGDEAQPFEQLAHGLPSAGGATG